MADDDARQTAILAWTFSRIGMTLTRHDLSEPMLPRNRSKSFVQAKSKPKLRSHFRVGLLANRDELQVCDLEWALMQWQNVCTTRLHLWKRNHENRQRNRKSSRRTSQPRRAAILAKLAKMPILSKIAVSGEFFWA